jgi:hypothetical protein
MTRENATAPHGTPEGTSTLPRPRLAMIRGPCPAVEEAMEIAAELAAEEECHPGETEWRRAAHGAGSRWLTGAAGLTAGPAAIAGSCRVLPPSR